MSDQTATRELTYGEKACGVNFNPGGDPDVAILKQKFAELVDIMHDFRTRASIMEHKETVRMMSIAITEAQTAQMWAVKAVTWSHA